MRSAPSERKHHRLSEGVTYLLLKEPSAIDSLRSDWWRLWAAARSPLPMLEFEWVREWWGQQGHNGTLFIVVAYRDGELIGLAPLYVRRRGHGLREMLRTVHFLGTGEAETEEVCGENLGWLASPANVPLVTDAVADALLRERATWDRIVLPYMGPETRAAFDLQQRLAPALLESSVVAHRSRIINVSPLDDYLHAIDSASRRARFRRWLRRGEAAGVQLLEAQTVDEALSMFEELVRLHQANWEARGEPGACSSPAFRGFHRRMLRHYAACGRLWVFGLKLDDRWIALHYDIEAGDTLYYYLSAIDPRASSKLSPGNLILLRSVELAARRGLARIDLMAGDYEFKRHLSNDVAETVTFDALQRSAAGRVWRGMRDARRFVLRDSA